MAVRAYCVFLVVVVQLFFTTALTAFSSIVTVNDCSSKSLIIVAHDITNWTIIKINCPRIVLSSAIRFADLQGIKIDGQGGIISCRNTAGSGLAFVNVEHIFVTNITIMNCGMQTRESAGVKLSTAPTRSAVLIVGCTGVTVTHIHVRSSMGTGLILLNATGSVKIKHSMFAHNIIHTSHNVCAGLHIGLSQVANSSYHIEQCVFTNNSAFSKAEMTECREGDGNCKYGDETESSGGLGIFLGKNSTKNKIVVCNSTFESNTAPGLGIAMRGSIFENTIMVANTSFSENHCEKCSGGGASILWQMSQKQQLNVISFTSCYFQGNQARFGGGVSLVSAKGGSHFSTNLVVFADTAWVSNTANFGAAINMRAGHWYESSACYQLNITFTGCQILSNSEKDVFEHFGTMRVTDSTVTFSESMLFSGNKGSAFVGLNTVLKIASGTFLQFHNNSGNAGGAMLLQSSQIYVIGHGNKAVSMNFTNNVAIFSGGAIHVDMIDKQEVKESKSCFFQCKQRQEINAYFRGNMAGVDDSTVYGKTNFTASAVRPGYGDMIFASTFRPCMAGCCSNGHRLADSYEFFNYTCNKCIFTVNANKRVNENYVHRASTPASYIIFFGDNPMKIIPGRETSLNLCAYDELNQTIPATYLATVSNGKDIVLDGSYSLLSNTSIKLYGRTGSAGELKLQAFGVLGDGLKIQVEMDMCPPGYVLDNGTQGPSCLCGAQKWYEAINYCEHSTFRAHLGTGKWAGYVNSSSNVTGESSLEFYTAPCPFGYCATTQEVFLPNTTSIEALEQLICSNSRHGNLCGECSENTTTAFHSQTFMCVTTEYCGWGPIFYIISELLPLTVIFLAITFFGIDFSTGGVNSLILFAQIQPMLFFSKANPKAIKSSQVIMGLYHAYNIIYGFFNLDFFNIDPLAFCLWNHANPLQMLSVRYLSTLYALVLVVSVVLFLNYCSCCLCWHKIMVWRRQKGFSSSIVNGIVAFLLLCYAQCAKVTIQILTTSFAHGKKGSDELVWVYYYAAISYFSYHHLWYAIPALVILVTFVLGPPFLLMSYPVCYRVMAFLHISNTRAGQFLTRWIEKLKPLLDAFQSPFKDKYRFTAGMYFLYRIAAPVVFVAVNGTYSYYVIMEVLFIVSLLFHSVTQPYQKMKNNIYHSLVMADLAIIMELYLYNYTRAQKTANETTQETLVTVILLILIYLPIVCALGNLAVKCTCFKKIKKLKKMTSYGRFVDSHMNSQELPARMTEDMNQPTEYIRVNNNNCYAANRV